MAENMLKGLLLTATTLGALSATPTFAQPNIVANTTTLHACLPTQQLTRPGEAYEVRTDISVSDIGAFVVAHHMSNGVTYVRNEQYVVQHVDKRDIGYVWQGFLRRNPNVHMKGYLQWFDDADPGKSKIAGWWRYSEYTTDNRDGPFGWVGLLVSQCQQAMPASD